MYYFISTAISFTGYKDSYKAKLIKLKRFIYKYNDHIYGKLLNRVHGFLLINKPEKLNCIFGFGKIESKKKVISWVNTLMEYRYLS